ncbi:MAG: hypothetical protein IJ684_01945, partial [Bacteroidales bacterium]|nr:hypothetical protein [Bacteroidales bacterium]
ERGSREERVKPARRRNRLVGGEGEACEVEKEARGRRGEVCEVEKEVRGRRGRRLRGGEGGSREERAKSARWRKRFAGGEGEACEVEKEVRGRRG